MFFAEKSKFHDIYVVYYVCWLEYKLGKYLCPTPEIFLIS